jgi:hypothetical protein
MFAVRGERVLKCLQKFARHLSRFIMPAALELGDNFTLRGDVLLGLPHMPGSYFQLTFSHVRSVHSTGRGDDQ